MIFLLISASDGLHPIWDQQFEFHIRCPELALLRFYVEDGDFVKTDPFIGQAVFPVVGIRTGQSLCTAPKSLLLVLKLRIGCQAVFLVYALKRVD